jgi:hypothetical protein
MEKIILKRDKLPPIAFTGELIGLGRSPGDTRWTVVRVYRTKGGRYVVARNHLTQWQGERDDLAATSCDDAAGVIAWLTADCGGKMGATSQEAIEDAAENDPAFAAAWIETVE